MTDELLFDPETEEGSHFDLIPAGSYVAEIIEAEIGQPKSGDGHMLKLTGRSRKATNEGRQLWQRLCYQHSSLQAQEIARRMLKDLCVALDINQQVNDPEIIKFNSNPDPDSTQTAFVCPDSEVGQIKIDKSLEVPDWREISTGKTGWMEFRASHRLCSPTNLATATLLAPQIASQRRLRSTAVLAKGCPRPLS